MKIPQALQAQGVYATRRLITGAKSGELLTARLLTAGNI